MKLCTIRSGFLGVFLTVLLAGPALGQQTQQERPDPNWSFECSSSGECQALAINRLENGQELMRMWAGKGPDDTAFLGVIVPLGLHIPNGVILSFDEGETVHTQMRLLNCKTTGCLAVTAMSPTLVLELRRSTDVTIVIRDSDTRTDLAFNMPLWGFSASFDQLRNQ